MDWYFKWISSDIILLSTTIIHASIDIVVPNFSFRYVICFSVSCNMKPKLKCQLNVGDNIFVCLFVCRIAVQFRSSVAHDRCYRCGAHINLYSYCQCVYRIFNFSILIGHLFRLFRLSTAGAIPLFFFSSPYFPSLSFIFRFWCLFLISADCMYDFSSMVDGRSKK